MPWPSVGLRGLADAVRRRPETPRSWLEVVLAAVLLVTALVALHRSTREVPPVALMRIQGETRVETAVAASRHWQSPATVMLVGVNAADEVLLRVAACAGDFDAPVLLVPPGGPTPLVQARLDELSAAQAQFVIWGGGSGS